MRTTSETTNTLNLKFNQHKRWWKLHHCIHCHQSHQKSLCSSVCLERNTVRYATILPDSFLSSSAKGSQTDIFPIDGFQVIQIIFGSLLICFRSSHSPLFRAIPIKINFESIYWIRDSRTTARLIHTLWFISYDSCGVCRSLIRMNNVKLNQSERKLWGLFRRVSF